MTNEATPGFPEDLTCSWLVEVHYSTLIPADAPYEAFEIDFPSQVWRQVPCGAAVIDDGHGSYHCKNGHRHVSYADPAFPAYEAEWAFSEQNGEF